MTPVTSDGVEWKITGASTINGTPTLNVLGAQYLTIGAPLDVALAIADEDVPSCIVTASSSNTTVCPLDKLSVSGSGASRTLHIAALNQTGTSTITVTVQDAQGAQSQQQFTLNSIATVTYTVTVSTSGAGTVTPGTVTLPSGANQSFSISAGTGYHIQDVTLDGVSQGTVSTVSFSNLQANHTIGVTFAVTTYLIDTSLSGSGTVSPDQTVNYGDTYNVTGTAGSGQFIKDVVIDGTNHLGAQSSPYTYTGFTNISAAHTIQFVFGNTAPSWVSSSIESYTATGFVARFQVNDPESQVLTVQSNVDGGGWTSPASGAIKRVSDNATVEYNAIASGIDYRLTVSGLTGASHTIDLRVNDGVNSAVQLSAPLDATIPAPSAPTGHFVVSGNAQVTLHPGASSNASSYNAYYTSDGSTPTTGSTKITGVTDGQVLSGLTNGTTYKFVFTAVNAGGESAVSTVDSASTTVTTAWGTSLDTTAWATSVSGGGSVTVSSGICTAAAPTDGAATLIWNKTPLNTAASDVWGVSVKTSTIDANSSVMIAGVFASPSVATNTTFNGKVALYLMADSLGNLALIYWDTGGNPHWYNASSNSWQTTPANLIDSSSIFSNYYNVYLVINGGQWKIQVKDANDSLIKETQFTNWNLLHNAVSSLYFGFGEPNTDYYQGSVYSRWALIP